MDDIGTKAATIIAEAEARANVVSVARAEAKRTYDHQWKLISDAGAIGHGSDVPLHPPGQGYAHGLRGAAVAALINGTVISIESGAASGAGKSEAAYQTQLLPALKAGQITLGQLQAAASRALLPRFHVGLYDPPEVGPPRLARRALACCSGTCDAGAIN